MSIAGHPIECIRDKHAVNEWCDITVTNPAACLSLMDSVEVKMALEAPD